MSDEPAIWRCRGRLLTIGPRTRIMGILNITPDSFSDGGRYATPDAALSRAREMLADGADLLDLGGESTRPGAAPVPEDEELRRVLPVLRALRAETDVPLSVDTRHTAVARAALDVGADIINDIAGLRAPGMAELIAATGAGAVVMHMQGEPGTMQAAPAYADVTREVGDFFRARRAALRAAGIADEQLVFDPGIGFGKTLAHNLALLRDAPALADAAGRPLLYGVSRKSWLGALTGRAAAERLAGSLAALAGLHARGARLFRVHDVKESCDAARVLDTMSAGEA